MNITRRVFNQWGMGTITLAALKPSWLRAQASGGFEGFGLTVAGKLKTRPSASIKASPLSVGYETLDRQHFDPAKTYALAAQLGVKWARVQTGWARCEKTRGVYDFSWLDEVVDNLLKIGIQPWFNLGYGNPLYTPKADATAVGWVPVFDEAAMEAWKTFTCKVSEHFKGRVSHWEIWNEPNITGFWKPGKPDAVSYVKLVEQTAPLIRERVAGAVIIGGGFAGIPMAYYASCLEAGMAKHVDKISYHPYRNSPEKGYEKEIGAMRELLRKHNAAHVGLWQGENGAPSQKGGAGALRDSEWNESRQARWVVRRIISDLRMEIELTSYFLIVDLVGYRGSTNWKGLLRGTDYTPKPAFFAYQSLCALFDAETRRSKITFAIEGAGEAQTCAAGFKRLGKPLVAFWAVEDLMKDTPPKKVQVILGEQEKAQMPKPALLDPLTGQIYKVASFDTVPLADYPLIIADESVFSTL